MSKPVANGPAIRAIRESLGIRGSDFATRCLISHAYLNNIEGGRKAPPEKVLDRIASELEKALPPRQRANQQPWRVIDAISHPAAGCPTCDRSVAA